MRGVRGCHHREALAVHALPILLGAVAACCAAGPVESVEFRVEGAVGGRVVVVGFDLHLIVGGGVEDVVEYRGFALGEDGDEGVGYCEGFGGGEEAVAGEEVRAGADVEVGGCVGYEVRVVGDGQEVERVGNLVASGRVDVAGGEQSVPDILLSNVDPFYRPRCCNLTNC